MKNLWLALLERAIRALIDFDWSILRAYILSLLDDNRTGDEKRRNVYDELRAIGSDIPTWLLNAAIEVAYGQIKNQLENQK